MSKQIAGKTFVITGGADGIGYNIADNFLENGGKVAILIDINETKGKEATDTLNGKYGDGKAEFIKCDVTKDLETTYNIIINNHKTVDVLINSAGIADESVPRRLIDINVTSSIEWSLKFFEHMRKDTGGKGGTIINVSSLLGFQITPFYHVYTASKFAINGFTRSLGHRKLYALSGVRAVTLCPGFTKTNLVKQMFSKEGENEWYDKFIEGVKKSNWQDASDVGKAALEVYDEAESGSVWAIDDGKLNIVKF